MSAALFIVLEREIPDYDPLVNGKALSRFEPELTHLAASLGVKPLMDFFSADPVEARQFLEEEGADAADDELPPESWFDAQEGLATVNALLSRIAQAPREVPAPDAVAGDLREFQAVLERAAAERTRWHLAVDF